MNEIFNKILLDGNKFAPELHFRQPGFTYSACGPFAKYREKIQKFKETGDLNYINNKELDKACFDHDAAYADNKYLAKSTTSGQILKYKPYEIA